MNQVKIDAAWHPLQRLLEAFATGDAAPLGEALVTEPRCYLSTHGNAYVQADLAAWFRDFYGAGKAVSCEVVNDVILQDKAGHAWQYANVLVRLSQGERRLALVGSFVCELACEYGRWLIKVLRFELQGDDAVACEWLDGQGIIHVEPGTGDRSLIEGWKLANDRVGLFMDPVAGQGAHVILAEFNAPWLLAGRDLLEKDLRALAPDLFARFCFAQDFMCFKLLSDVLAPGAQLVLDGREFAERDGILYLKQRRQGWPLSFTAGRLAGLSQRADGRFEARFERVGIWEGECPGWTLALCQRDGELFIERLVEELSHE